MRQDNRMKNIWLIVLVLAMVGFGIATTMYEAASLMAQQPTTSPEPTKDELAIAWLETAKLAAQLANTQCQQLDSVKQFVALQATTTKRIEARLHGYTVDWQTFTIILRPQSLTK